MAHKEEVTLKNVLRLPGQEDKLKETLITRLIKCGWEAEMKLACTRIIKGKGVENVTVDSLTKGLTAVGREKISAEVKKEMLERIKST